MIKVSIIIPIYNVESYLSDLVSAIKLQKLSDFETIFVIDGSPDCSVEKLRNLVKQDSRFIIIEQSNKGSGESRNVGMRHAKGEYLYFADPDDIMSPNLLSDNVKILEQKKADILVFGYNQIESETKDIFVKKRFLDMQGEYYYRNKSVNELFDIMNWALWNKIIRRNFIIEHDLESPQWSRSQDAGFMMQILKFNPRIVFNNLDLCYYSYRTNRQEAATSKFFELAPKYQSIISNVSLRFANNQETNLFLYKAYLGNIMRYSVLSQLNRKMAPKGLIKKINYIKKSRQLINKNLLKRVIFDKTHELSWSQRLFSVIVYLHLEFLLISFLIRESER